ERDENVADALRELPIHLLQRIRVEEHDIQIAVRIQLPAPVTADRHDGEAGGIAMALFPRAMSLAGKLVMPLVAEALHEVPHHQIDQARALAANLAPAL